MSAIILWHFLVSFLPQKTFTDLRRAPYYEMCVNESENKVPKCTELSSANATDFIIKNRKRPEICSHIQ